MSTEYSEESDARGGAAAATRVRIAEARTRIAAETATTDHPGRVRVEPGVLLAGDVVWTCESLQSYATVLADVAHTADVPFGTFVDLIDLAHMYQQAHDAQCTSPDDVS